MTLQQMDKAFQVQGHLIEEATGKPMMRAGFERQLFQCAWKNPGWRKFG